MRLLRILLTAGLATSVILGASAVSAGAREPGPQLSVVVRPVVLAKGSAGKTVQVEVSATGGTARDVRLTWDAAEIIDVAQFLKMGNGSGTAGRGCGWDESRVLCMIDKVSGRVPEALTLTLKPVAEARRGATRNLRITATAPNTNSVLASVGVTVGGGVDLVTGGNIEVAGGRPGATVDPKIVVTNNGDESARGAVLTINGEAALKVGPRFPNCVYGNATMTCTIRDELSPGVQYEPSKPVSFTVAPDAFGPAMYEGSYEVENHTGGAGPGSADDLHLVARGKATPPTWWDGCQRQGFVDVDRGDNCAHVTVGVAANPADLAVVGATVTGKAGDAVRVDVGLRNLGPASLRMGAGSAAHATIGIPAGTEAVEVPRQCAPLVGDKPDYAKVGRPGAVAYRCYGPEQFDAGGTATFNLTLKINQVMTDSVGVVSLGTDKFDGQLRRIDANPRNDSAKIVVNPAVATATTAAASGGAAAGLPLTGTKVALVGLGGAGVLVLGAVLVFVARRRRVVLVADEVSKS